MIAAFDPSVTHLGWVTFDENLTGKDAVQEAGVFATDTSTGMIVQRLILQRERVRRYLETRNIRFVVMEAPIMQEFSTELLYALHYYLHEVFLDLKVFLLLIHSSTWKSVMFPGIDTKMVTKHHSSHLAKEELDRQGKRFSEHVADAYHLGKIGHTFYRWHVMRALKDEDLSEKIRELFCGKHTYTRGVKKGLTEYTGLIYRENELFFDYAKQPRDVKTIVKEITDGDKIETDPETAGGKGETGKARKRYGIDAGRIL